MFVNSVEKLFRNLLKHDRRKIKSQIKSKMYILGKAIISR